MARQAWDGRRVAGFGMGAVDWTTPSTILGPVLFLRLGWAVGSVGLLGAVAATLVGHLVTVPTAMAVAEISTNQHVPGAAEPLELVKTGRPPISPRNFGVVVPEDGEDRKAIVCGRSHDADPTLLGFPREALRQQERALFEGYDDIGTLLFVSAVSEIEMDRPSAPAGVDEEKVHQAAQPGAEPDAVR